MSLRKRTDKVPWWWWTSGGPEINIERNIETVNEPDGRVSFKVSVASKDLEMKVRGEVELTLDGVTYTVRSHDQD